MWRCFFSGALSPATVALRWKTQGGRLVRARRTAACAPIPTNLPRALVPGFLKNRWCADAGLSAFGRIRPADNLCRFCLCRIASIFGGTLATTYSSRHGKVKKNPSHFSHYLRHCPKTAVQTNGLRKRIHGFPQNHADCRGSWAKATRSIQLNPAKSFARESQRREVLTARSQRLCRSALSVCDFTYKKQICEQSAEMDGSVQVVDQLRADGGLCENQLNRGERVAGVAVKHRKECLVSLGRLKAFLFNRRCTALCQTRHRSHGTAQIFADPARMASFVTRKPLCRVGQHKFVAFFDRVAAR